MAYASNELMYHHNFIVIGLLRPFIGINIFFTLGMVPTVG